MIILRCAPLHRQAVLLVLDVAPHDIVEGPQRVDGDMRERIAVAYPAHVLEALADGIHRLNQHALFVPIRPDELNQTGAVSARSEDACAENAALVHTSPCPGIAI